MILTATFHFGFGTMKVWAKDINKAVDVVRTISGCPFNQCGEFEPSLWQMQLPPGITLIYP